MNVDYQHKEQKPKRDAPLFESTWLALFFLLRRGWLQYRNQT